MGEHHIPPFRRLVLYLASAGGSATRTQIRKIGFRGHLSAAQLSEAIAEAPALFESTRVHGTGPGARRPAERLTLTVLGHAYAQTYRPDYKPARLAQSDWQAQLTEMLSEQVPIAVQIDRDREDGPKWRAAEAARKAKDRAREKKIEAELEAIPKRPSAERNRSEEDLEQRAAWFAKTMKKAGHPDYQDPDDSKIPSSDADCYQSGPPARIQPTAQEAAPPVDCKCVEIKGAGFGSARRGDHLFAFGGRNIGCTEYFRRAC